MHIALANFYLSVTGPPMPSDIKSNQMEKTVTAKPEVIDWLKRSLSAVKTAHATVTASDLQRCAHERDRAALVREGEIKVTGTREFASQV
jgi:hypothetical protein